MKRTLSLGAIAFWLALNLACSFGPLEPAPASSSCNCLSGGGLVTATLDGQPFSAEVDSANYESQGLLVFTGVAPGHTFAVSIRAKLGQASLGANVVDPETGKPSTNSAQLAKNGAGAPTNWATGFGVGSGTVTVDSLSQTAAAGSFSLTMAPLPGTSAAGDRQMSGTFTLAF